MSFLDDLNDFFISGDTFYPDNKKRKSRVKSLEEDCNSYIALCEKEGNKGNALMEQLREKISDLETTNEDIPWELKFSASHQVGSSPYEKMLNIYCNLSGNPIINLVWQTTSAIMHKQSAAELAQELGITMGISVTMFAENIIFCGLPVAIFTPGIFNGARNRSELRKGIKNGLKSRREIYKVYYVNKCFNGHLKSVLEVVDAFQTTGVSLNSVTETLQKKIDEFKNDLNMSLEQNIDCDLKQRDDSLGRWTKED